MKNGGVYMPKKGRADPEEKKSKNLGARSMTEIRAVEGEDKRRFILSFSSEEPYERYFGMEILDHGTGAVDLKRLKEVGVLLFNHDSYEVLGKVLKAWIEDNRGLAEVEFDDDSAAEVIYQKVKSGTLKTTSVRYRVHNWETVMPGKKSTDGRFTGPCEIARKWTPYEISIVSVPADATVGVGRDMDLDDETEPRSAGLISIYERQITINKNFLLEETR
jgi:HK97 family phage prohead protease